MGWVVAIGDGGSGSLPALQDFCSRIVIDEEDHPEFVSIFPESSLPSARNNLDRNSVHHESPNCPQ